MRKIFRKVHLWLSVPFGLLISAICFSGAALVFEEEVTQWVRHDWYYVDRAEGVPLSTDSLARRVAATLPPDVSISGVTRFGDPQRTCQVNLSTSRRAAIFVDPYTGEIRGKYQRPAFFSFMFRLHRWLLDSARGDNGMWIGKWVVGVSTLLFVVVLITGLLQWWPRDRKAWGRSLKIAMTKGRRRFWRDFHVVGGVYAFVLLMVMALTGLTWSFNWYRTGFYKLFGVETLQTAHATQTIAPAGEKNGSPTRSEQAEPTAVRPFAHWQEVYEVLAVRHPDYKQIRVSDGTASVSFHRLGNQHASDRYTFDRQTGQLEQVTRYADSAASSKIHGWIYSLHVGSWGGMLMRILSFLVALFGGTLPLTGYYLWIRKWKRRGATSCGGQEAATPAQR